MLALFAYKLWREEIKNASMKVKVTQSWLSLCEFIVHTVHGILQARILPWAPFPFSSRSSWPRNWTGISCIGLPCSSNGKESACDAGDQEFWVGKILWRRDWQSTPVFLPGEFLGQRSLEGYCSRCSKESDTTEWLTYTHTLLHCRQILYQLSYHRSK